MRWVRSVIAVVLGYVISQGLNAGFVYYWYFGDRSLGTTALFAATLVFFALTGVACGYLVAKLGGPHGKVAGLLVAALVAVVTLGNIVADVAAEPLWHKLVVLLVMAPALAVTASRAAVARSGDPA